MEELAGEPGNAKSSIPFTHTTATTATAAPGAHTSRGGVSPGPCYCVAGYTRVAVLFAALIQSGTLWGLYSVMWTHTSVYVCVAYRALWWGFLGLLLVLHLLGQVEQTLG